MRPWSIAIAIAAPLAFYGNHAFAKESYYIETGNELFARCTEGQREGVESAIPFGICYGFINAMIEESRCGQDTAGFSSRVPEGANFGQVRKVVMKWLNEHPETLHMGASGLVSHALQDAFPCQ